ncbi:hypothetical protein DIPPA_34195 [Diplonema papillatum]|nr:hypothetical protein DIPPA_34195 [Diplonema papillatum]
MRTTHVGGIAALAVGTAGLVVLWYCRRRRVEDVEEVLRTEFGTVWLQVSTKKGLNERLLGKWLKARGIGLGEMIPYLRGDNGGLAMEPSRVPSAGTGLFATRKFAEGDLICVYRGTKRPLSEVRLLPMEARDYLMGGFGLLWHLDARTHTECKARYINDILAERGHNVTFVKVKPDFCAKCVALRDIQPGEELYAKYGSSYWTCRGVVAPYIEDVEN